ncbi:unnamed protein product [Macrosiphum euphorbiae]|uniref:Uncharacterized protein n=1 Tax=Macrosiphum euphorbiae TaxID=13131 RepID=A0AAV0WAS2_9HEMI|nr:unnamed protein product [Macrosiphum euphorbiae]
MCQQDFKSTKNLQNTITKRKKNIDNQPVSWLKMQWIRVVKEEPYTLYYKETLQEDFPFSALNLKPSKVGRPPSLGLVSTPNLYQRPRPVTHAKQKDMFDLLPYIPPIYHDFFKIFL